MKTNKSSTKRVLLLVFACIAFAPFVLRCGGGQMGGYSTEEPTTPTEPTSKMTGSSTVQQGSSVSASSDSHFGWVKTSIVRVRGVEDSSSGQIYRMTDPVFRSGKEAVRSIAAKDQAARQEAAKDGAKK